MIRAVVKRPDRSTPYVTNISTKLESLYRTLDGTPERLTIAANGMLIYTRDHDGEENQRNGEILGRRFFGTVILTGRDENGEPADWPLSMKDTKRLIRFE